MSSKMREALASAALLQKDKGYLTPMEVADEIAQRYGDLEFTREEVRGMLEEMAVHYPARDYVREETVNSILSRHTEGEGHKLDPKSAQVLHDNFEDLLIDDTPTIKASDANKPSLDKRVSALEQVAHSPVDFGPRFDRIERKIAAIEKRLLADGHAMGCCKTKFCLYDGKDWECTCGHDKIRENSK